MVDDEQDEELVQPPRREWPSLGRPLVALAGVIAVGAAVITISTSGSDEPARPEPTPTPSVLSLPADDGPYAPQQDVLPEAQLGQLPLCPTGRICETSYNLPDAPEASVGAHFPGARVTDSRTLVARRAPDDTELVARVLLARSGAVTVAVSILPTTANDVVDASAEDDGTRFLGTAQEHVLGLTVSVRVVGPSGTHVSIGTLQDFVLDRRLLTRPAADRGQSDDKGQR